MQLLYCMNDVANIYDFCYKINMSSQQAIVQFTWFKNNAFNFHTIHRRSWMSLPRSKQRACLSEPWEINPGSSRSAWSYCREGCHHLHRHQHQFLGGVSADTAAQWRKQRTTSAVGTSHNIAYQLCP